MRYSLRSMSTRVQKDRADPNLMQQTHALTDRHNVLWHPLLHYRKPLPFTIRTFRQSLFARNARLHTQDVGERT